MRANHLHTIIALVALATTAACARRGRPAEPASAVTVARITNNNWLDIRVYADRGGSRDRIGLVRSFETQVFELPRHLVEAHALRLYVDAIGSPQSYRTDVIQVWPGQLIDLVVQERLTQSYYSVLDP
jgi:hypothetical protein